jgi:hypothetical protein
MAEVTWAEDMDRMRREFEKLPIDEQLSNLRDGLRAMVNHVEARGAADPTDGVESVKPMVSRSANRLCIECIEELISLVDKVDSKVVRRDIYRNLDVLLIGWGVATAFRSDLTSEFTRIQRTINTNPRREARSSTKNMRERRAQMRPFVEVLKGEFAHVPFEERTGIIKKALMKNPDFRRILPRDLKDPRYLDKDIAAIVGDVMEAESESD